MPDPATDKLTLTTTVANHPTGEGETRVRKGFGRLTPAEASRLGVEAKRAKAAERAARAEQDALTVRQRLGVALSAELTIEDWRLVIQAAKKKGDTASLVRMANQAFGVPQAAEEDRPADAALAELTREQRAVVREWLAQADENPANPEIP